MADHLSEEEQLESLKQWWKDNGKFTVIGVALAVAGYFGWEAWQTQQREQAQSSAVIYDELVKVLEVEPGKSLTQEQRANATHFVQQLKDTNADSLYAKNAALLSAGLAVQDHKLDQAATELRWILDNQPPEGVVWVAKVRLARVLLAQGQLEEALALVEGDITPSFDAVYAQMRGDILVTMKRMPEARTAYQRALDKLLPSQTNHRSLLQMKLDDLPSAVPTVASAEDV